MTSGRRRRQLFEHADTADLVGTEQPTRTIGLAAVPHQDGPVPDQDTLKAWYQRHGFRPAPLREDWHRMVRPGAPTAPSAAIP
ncbi:hypothetical protein [Streptomyces sp. NPDC056056]|uniref:hypothetical protein n=1 Tax=Streptomyces sp. NPDC056056 TaxID=3345698 RepID=UPI0035DF374F